MFHNQVVILSLEVSQTQKTHSVLDFVPKFLTTTPLENVEDF